MGRANGWILLPTRIGSGAVRCRLRFYLKVASAIIQNLLATLRLTAERRSPAAGSLAVGWACRAYGFGLHAAPEHPCSPARTAPSRLGRPASVRHRIEVIFYRSTGASHACPCCQCRDSTYELCSTFVPMSPKNGVRTKRCTRVCLTTNSPDANVTLGGHANRQRMSLTPIPRKALASIQTRALAPRRCTLGVCRSRSKDARAALRRASSLS